MKIYLYGRVSSYMQEELRYMLRMAKEDEEIDVFVNSGGGDLFAGIAMYNILKRHKGVTNGYVDGFAGSMMSIIPLACDNVFVGEGTSIMIHDPLAGTVGNEKEHANKIKVLQGVKENMIDIYSNKLKMDRDAIAEIMSAETYYNAKEAVEVGWADKIVNVNSEADESMSAEATLSIVAELTNYKNVPNEVREKFGINGSNNNNSNEEEETDMANGNKPAGEISGLEVATLIAEKDTEISGLKADHEKKVGELQGEITAKDGEISTLKGELSAKDGEISALQAEVDTFKAEKVTAEEKAKFSAEYPNFVGEKLDKAFLSMSQAKSAGLDEVVESLQASFKKENALLSGDAPIFSAEGESGEGEEMTDAKFEAMVKKHMADNGCDYLTATSAVAKLTGESK